MDNDNNQVPPISSFTQVQLSQNTQLPSPSRLRLGKSLWMVLGGVTLLITGIVVGFFTANNNKLPTIKNTNSMQAQKKVEDSSRSKKAISWKVFTDETHKFSLEYPDVYTFSSSQRNYYDRKTYKETTQKIQSYYWKQGEEKIAGGVTGDAIHLEIYPKDLEPFYQANEDKGDTVLIAGQKVKKRYGLGGSIITIGPFTHKGYIFVIQYDVPENADQAMFNKFISSMKLL